MGSRNAIVVRRAQKLGGYRDGDGGESLVLEQIAGPSGGNAIALSALLGSAGLFTGPLFAHSPIAIGVAVVALAVAGAGLGSALERLFDRRVRTLVRLVVGDRALRLYRPAQGEAPTATLAVADLARIEVVPHDVEDPPRTWSLVAIGAHGESIELLATRDRTAGLRARTLVLDRLVRDGAFEGEPIASTPCPACSARIIAPHRWLPTSFACGQCGVEGTFARAA